MVVVAINFLSSFTKCVLVKQLIISSEKNLYQRGELCFNVLVRFTHKISMLDDVARR